MDKFSNPRKSIIVSYFNYTDQITGLIHSSGNYDRKSNSLTLTEIIILCYYSVKVCLMERVVQLDGVVEKRDKHSFSMVGKFIRFVGY